MKAPAPTSPPGIPLVLIDADAVTVRPLANMTAEIRRRYWRGYSPATIAAVLEIDEARVDAALFAPVPA